MTESEQPCVLRMAPCCLIFDPIGSLGILSNYAITPFQIDGQIWPSVEHFFQGMKFVEFANRELIRAAAQAHAAKELAWGDLFDQIRPDWDSCRVDVMHQALQAKFNQCGTATGDLLSTWPMPLIENSSEDSFWGIGEDGCGQNQLGRSLEWVRSALVGQPALFGVDNSAIDAARGGRSRVAFAAN